MLLLILQRYYFESESQPLSNFISLAIRCCLSYKDTILKANHSLKDTCMSDACAVAYPTKILFWKRITANWRKWRIYGMLLLILQRYYFESESQQLPNSGPTVGCCCLSYKDTILKANHSISGQITGLPVLLLILQRYYFESESQPGMASVCKLRSCCLSYKDTILKANHSTLNYAISFEGAVAYPTKILFWKRITASRNDCTDAKMLLLILQRYYFESESQRFGSNSHYQYAVAYPTKILFWKRITAYICSMKQKDVLLLILQRYYFESESQPGKWKPFSMPSCCLSYKDTILKANHSYLL